MPYPGDSLYIAGLFTDPNVAKKISSVGVSSCADLYCSHEEADTRTVLHAMHADKEFGRKNTKGRILVKSPDTDVFCTLCTFLSIHVKYQRIMVSNWNYYQDQRLSTLPTCP